MSKRLKNYPDPELVINAHGADALRLYLINSPVVREAAGWRKGVRQAGASVRARQGLTRRAHAVRLARRRWREALSFKIAIS